MTPNKDNSRSGIPTWACPWQASWTAVPDKHTHQPHALPKNAHRRIERIGVAASGVAATIWVLAMVWVWQVIA
ncbi:MAG TPA: hypothetical protein VM937_01700 [Burkholderiaceae bacterium]|jgi:hypothetical protein|nr:hypothetical protein [Burkholderiaceae bacterium]